MAMVFLATDALAAQAPVGLGTADPFAVLAGSTVTNTGPSTINGDLGLSPGTAVTGFPPGTVNGTIHAADAVAAQAQADLTTAYNDAAGRPPTAPEVTVPTDIGGLTLTAGAYKYDSSVQLTGPLTLDAQGDPNAVFVFEVGSTLTTASASSVKLINGAQPCHVYWQIGSSATLGTSSVFVGSILAYTSISMNNAVTVDGRALARNGAVTLIDDTITAAACSTGGGGGGGTGGGGGGGGTGGGGGGGGTGGGGTGGGGTGGGGTGGGGTGGGGTGGGGTGGGGTGGGGGGGTGGGGGGTGGGAGGGTTPHRGIAVLRTTPNKIAKRVSHFGVGRCVARTFRVVVTGRHIRRVVFSIGGRTIATRSRSPWAALVASGNGIRTITARVTFTHNTRGVMLHMRFRSCAAAKRHASPSQQPVSSGGFTG